MPKTKNVIKRLQLIDKYLRTGKFSYKELKEKVEDMLVKDEISIRTIQNDLTCLECDFHAPIKKVQEGHKIIVSYSKPFELNLGSELDDEGYKALGNALYTLENYKEIPQYAWVYSCLEQICLNRFMDDNSPIIMFDHNSLYENTEYISKLAEAIQKKRPLRITYKPFTQRLKTGEYVEPERQEYKIYPYLIKEYNKRWFLIAHEEGSEHPITNFALDRIKNIEPYCKKYIECEIDLNDYFKNIIGVSVFPNKEPQDIHLRVSKRRYPYIKTKPIHRTQKEIVVEDDFAEISITVCPNRELYALLLYFGDDIEVLSPPDLREAIARIISRMNKKYEQ